MLGTSLSAVFMKRFQMAAIIQKPICRKSVFSSSVSSPTAIEFDGNVSGTPSCCSSTDKLCKKI